jgi:putative ABC transport system permease protein
VPGQDRDDRKDRLGQGRPDRRQDAADRALAEAEALADPFDAVREQLGPGEDHDQREEQLGEGHPARILASHVVGARRGRPRPVTEGAGAANVGRGRDPLWSKAPLLLWRFPRVLVSLWVGAALLAFAAAAYPLMLSARTTRLIHDRIADPAVTRFGGGITYAVVLQGFPPSYAVDAGPTPEEIGRDFAKRTRDPSLGRVVATELGSVVSIGTPEGTADARIFAGDGAFDHVALLARTSGDGVWLPDLTARALHVGSGDSVTIRSRDGSVEVPVAAIYRARVGEPRTGYWQAWDQQIYPKCTNECPVPPPFVLATRARMNDLMDALRLTGLSYAWTAPVDGDPTLEDARRIAGIAEALQDDAGRTGASLPCCRPIEVAGAALSPRLASAMPSVVRRANGEAAGMAGPGRLLQVTALAVALAVVAASAAAGHAARRTELRLLFSRGESTASVGTRAAVEATVPVVAGAATGLLAGLAVVPLFGAGARASGVSIADAGIGALAAAVASVVVVGAVSAVMFARHDESARGGLRLAARVPWELAVGALALLAFERLRANGAFVEQSATGIRVPSLTILVFPVLAIGAVATLVARLAVFAAEGGRERTDRSPPWLFLAARRLTADAGSSLVFAATAGLCIGIFVMAQTVAASLSDTVEAKAELFVGSDVQATISYDAPVVASFPLPVTRVSRVPAAATLVPGGAQVDILAVDPRTLADAAFWRDGLSGESLADIASTLGAPSTDLLPVVVVGGDDPVASLDVGGTDVPVRVVATATAFPGMASDHPMVVVPAAAFTDRFAGKSNPLRAAGATTQLWIRGPTTAALAALRGIPYEPDPIVTADEVADIPHIAIVLGTFSTLRLLGSLAALLVVATVLLYLQARQRAQLVSYGLSLRMGMSDRAQRRSTLAEVLAALGLAVVVGVTTALVVATVLVPMLDPIPSIRPAAFLDVSAAPIVAILAAAVATAWRAARSTNRTARSADLGQVMRGVE